MSDIQRIIPNYQIQKPTPLPAEPQTQVPSKPIFTNESSISKCVIDDPTTISRKAVPFCAKPVLAPPREVVIKAAETIEIFIQKKPLETFHEKTIDFVEEKSDDTPSQEQEAHEEVPNQANDLLVPQTKSAKNAQIATLVAKEYENEHDESQFIESVSSLFDPDEEEDSLTNNRLKNKRLTFAKVGKTSIKDLLALVSKKESDTKDDLSQENDQEDNAIQEQRSKEAIVRKKEKSFDPDRENLLALSDQRGLHRVQSALVYDEIKHAKEFSLKLNQEINQLFESISKRSNGVKILGWVGKIANIASGGSAIIIAAVTLATGGIGGFLAVIPAAAQLLNAGAKLGEGIMSMENQHDQAMLTGSQAMRELVKSKMYDLLGENQKAIKIQYTLSKTSSDIIRNMTRVNTYNPTE